MSSSQKPTVKGQCHFKNEWLNESLFPEFAGWLTRINDCKAGCLLCKTGKATIDLHPSSPHLQSVNISNSNISSVPIASRAQVASVKNYCLTEDVHRAEILYAFCQIRKQASLRCFSDLSECFPIMFSDSNIAKKFKMHKDKLSYCTTYGLGPHFQKQLVAQVQKCDIFSVSLYESLNKIAQKGQMDIVLRIWVEVNGREKIETRYLTSCFLETATANGILTAFISVFKNFDIDIFKKIVNLSMDGPNVNLKFLKDFKFHMSQETDGGNMRELIEVGTCSLHVVNNGYKAGHQKSGWKIDDFLRSAYYLFKDFPSRRGIFSRITGCFDFPRKFCSTRWVENSEVMIRDKTLLPHMKSYVLAVQKKPPQSKRFKIVEEFLKDPLLEAKLPFLICISVDLEKFLTSYQTNKPLLPFLYHDLYVLTNDLLSRVLKSDVMKKVKTANDLLRIDLDNKNNLCLPSQVDIGISASSNLKSISKKLKDSDIMKFRMDCQKIVIEICRKIMAKSPLKYKFLKAAACLNPTVMQIVDSAKIRITSALEILVEHKYITDLESETIYKEYMGFIKKKEVLQKLREFSRKKHSLDEFLMDLCTEQQCSSSFRKFIKTILLFFHGNAAVERDFSYNKEFLVENLQEESLIAQRSLHDYLMRFEKVTDVPIDKNMIISFKSSSSKRVEALKQKRENEDSAKKRKRELSEKIQILKMKRQEAEENVTNSQKDIDAIEKELGMLQNTEEQ